MRLKESCLTRHHLDKVVLIAGVLIVWNAVPRGSGRRRFILVPPRSRGIGTALVLALGLSGTLWTGIPGRAPRGFWDSSALLQMLTGLMGLLSDLQSGCIE